MIIKNIHMKIHWKIPTSCHAYVVSGAYKQIDNIFNKSHAKVTVFDMRKPLVTADLQRNGFTMIIATGQRCDGDSTLLHEFKIQSPSTQNSRDFLARGSPVVPHHILA